MFGEKNRQRSDLAGGLKFGDPRFKFLCKFQNQLVYIYKESCWYFDCDSTKSTEEFGDK